MSFPCYPKYKDSGVEWLGKVPAHWDIKRLGYYFTERREKVRDVDHPPLSVTKMGIVPQLETAAKTDDNDNRKRVCKGDFVINSRSDRKGSAGVSDLDGSVSLINTVLEPRDTVHPMFAHSLLRSHPFQEEFYRFGKGIVADLWSTNYSEMRNIVLAMPCLAEQRIIASFVGSESTKIDGLVAEQQRLIELLKEKRGAVISRAVTAVAPGTTRLGNLIDILPGYAFSSDEFSPDETRIRLLRGINVSVGTCRWEDTVYWLGDLDSRLQEYVLRPADLVMGMDRPWITEGTRVARVRAHDLPALLVQRVARIRPREGVCQLFVEFVLSSREFRAFLEADLTGVSVPHISEGQIAGFRVPLLTEESQVDLAREIERAIQDTDLLVADAKRAIALLQERRSALISAAVTGKIDVRAMVDAAEAA